MQDLLEGLVVFTSAHKYFYLGCGYAPLQISQLRVLDYFESWFATELTNVLNRLIA